MSARHSWAWTTLPATLHVQRGRHHQYFTGTVDRCTRCGALRRMTDAGGHKSYSTDGGRVWTEVGASCPPCPGAV